jgi:hypothetical protein
LLAAISLFVNDSEPLLHSSCKSTVAIKVVQLQSPQHQRLCRYPAVSSSTGLRLELITFYYFSCPDIPRADSFRVATSERILLLVLKRVVVVADAMIHATSGIVTRKDCQVSLWPSQGQHQGPLSRCLAFTVCISECSDLKCKGDSKNICISIFIYGHLV